MVSALTSDMHRMTADEYFAVATTAGWERTELIEGFVYDMSPEHLLHARIVMALAQGLANQRPDLGVVASVSVRLDELTVVEPDVVAYASAAADDDAPLGAEDVRIVVEVSVSTVARDTQMKQALYANAAVPDYWVVIPKNGVVLQHKDPREGGYHTVREHEFDVQDLAALVRTLLAE